MAYDKTNWESLPSTNTPINATNLNKIENELANKNILTAGLSSNYTFTSTGQVKINMNSIVSQIGNKLSLQNGSIVIGERSKSRIG